MSTETAKDVLAAWETSSQYWTKHQSLIAAMFAPLTSALVDAAQIGTGQSVLDVGGGSGEPSLTLATIVGSSGSVTFTDPATGMVKAARVEAERRGLSNITFHQSPAERLSFSDNTFDAVVSRLSAMFFEDPGLALSEILRVAKPGGRLAFLVWAAREVNPFFSAISDVLNQFVSPEPDDEDAPNAFRFAKPGKLASLFSNAGAMSVTEKPLRFRIENRIDFEEFWELRTEMSDSFRGKLSQLTSDQIAAVKVATAKAVAVYFENGTMSFPAQALIVSGQKH